MDDPMLAEIKLFGGDYAPCEWQLCQGQLLEIRKYPSLFALISNRFGGDGRITYAVPDLRGCFALGMGTGPGRTPRDIGDSGGVEQVTLSEDQMPAHSHELTTALEGNVTAQLKCYNGDANGISPVNCSLSKQGTNSVGDAKVYSRSTPDSDMKEGSIETTHNLSVTGSAAKSGGSASHENMPPWLCLNYIIAVEGVYPPRP